MGIFITICVLAAAAIGVLAIAAGTPHPRLDDVVFCVICFLAVLANAAIFHGRATVYAEGDPIVLAEGRRIVRAFVLYLGGLLLIDAIGAAFGLAGALRPFDPGPIRPFDVLVSVLYAAVLARATWWVFRQGGAQLLGEHHQMFRFFPRTPTGVKLLWTVFIVVMGWSLYEIGSGRVR